jgi:hypothetical protein
MDSDRRQWGSDMLDTSSFGDRIGHRLLPDFTVRHLFSKSPAIDDLAAQLAVPNVGVQTIVPGNDSQRHVIVPLIASIKRLVGRINLSHCDSNLAFSKASPAGDRYGSIGLPAPAGSKMSHRSGVHTAKD